MYLLKNNPFIILVLLISCNNVFQLKEGDLLFQDLDSSPICEAIESVTDGFNGANISHIGLIVLHNNELQVLEAIPPRITLTNIEDFLNRSLDLNQSPKVLVGRLKESYSHAIPNAVFFAKEKIGTSYDDLFLRNNDLYYCSELIYEAFEEDSIFELEPMTFLDPENGDTMGIWQEYYGQLDEKIPEGKPGINPGIISLSNKIEIIHHYGILDGLKK